MTENFETRRRKARPYLLMKQGDPRIFASVRDLLQHSGIARHTDFIGLRAAWTSVLLKSCPGDSPVHSGLRTTGLTPSYLAHFTPWALPEIFLHK